VLARDLPAGAVPAGDDLRMVLLPAAAVPADAVPPAAGGGAAVGQLAVAVRRGDVLTGRQLGAGWASAAGRRAYTLPVGDGVEVGPLAPGDRVDVLAVSSGRARTVLRAAPVLRLLPGGDGRAALVVVGVTAGQAEALAGARAAGTLTLVQAPPETPVG
jgi:Flp pilus assembly protein CpaB